MILLSSSYSWADETALGAAIIQADDLARTPAEAINNAPVSADVRQITEQWHQAYVGRQRSPEYLATLGDELSSQMGTQQTSWVALVLELDIAAGGTDMWRQSRRRRYSLPWIHPTYGVVAAAHYYDLSRPDSPSTQVADQLLRSIEGHPARPNFEDHRYFIGRYGLSSPSLIVRMSRMAPARTLTMTLNGGNARMLSFTRGTQREVAEAAAQIGILDAQQMFNLVGERDATEAAEQAIEALVDGPHWVVRLYALHAMAGNPGLWDHERFERLLNDENEHVAREAGIVVRALQRNAGADRVPRLEQAPEQPDEDPADDNPQEPPLQPEPPQEPRRTIQNVAD
jgi:hypothetical protein